MMRHNNHDSKMMWLMMVCCLAPVLLIFILNAGVRGPGAAIAWIIFGILAAYAIRHLAIKKSGRDIDHQSTEEAKKEKHLDSHSDHACH